MNFETTDRNHVQAVNDKEESDFANSKVLLETNTIESIQKDSNSKRPGTCSLPNIDLDNVKKEYKDLSCPVVSRELTRQVTIQETVHALQNLLPEREEYLKNIYKHEPDLASHPEWFQERRKEHLKKEIENVKRQIDAFCPADGDLENVLATARKLKSIEVQRSSKEEALEDPELPESAKQALRNEIENLNSLKKQYCPAENLKAGDKPPGQKAAPGLEDESHRRFPPADGGRRYVPPKGECSSQLDNSPGPSLAGDGYKVGGKQLDNPPGPSLPGDGYKVGGKQLDNPPGPSLPGDGSEVGSEQIDKINRTQTGHK